MSYNTLTIVQIAKYINHRCVIGAFRQACYNNLVFTNGKTFVVFDFSIFEYSKAKPRAASFNYYTVVRHCYGCGIVVCCKFTWVKWGYVHALTTVRQANVNSIVFVHKLIRSVCIYECVCNILNIGNYVLVFGISILRKCNCRIHAIIVLSVFLNKKGEKVAANLILCAV